MIPSMHPWRRTAADQSAGSSAWWTGRGVSVRVRVAGVVWRARSGHAAQSTAGRLNGCDVDSCDLGLAARDSQRQVLRRRSRTRTLGPIRGPARVPGRVWRVRRRGRGRRRRASAAAVAGDVGELCTAAAGGAPRARVRGRGRPRRHFGRRRFAARRRRARHAAFAGDLGHAPAAAFARHVRPVLLPRSTCDVCELAAALGADLQPVAQPSRRSRCRSARCRRRHRPAALDHGFAQTLRAARRPRQPSDGLPSVSTEAMIEAADQADVGDEARAVRQPCVPGRLRSRRRVRQGFPERR